MEQTQRLLSRIQLANYFKQQCLEVVGVTPQRLGQQVGQTNTATGIEQAVSGSYAQTENYFIQHSDYLMPRVHQMRTDLAQYYHSRNPSVRLSYMTSAEERVNFEISGTDLMLRDLNVYCTTSANHRAILEKMKAIAENNNTAGASIYDLGNIVQSSSLAELNVVLKTIDQKAIEQSTAERESMEKLKQAEIEARIKEKQMMLDAEALENEKNRRRDILVAEIRAAGYGAMVDIDKNQQSDFKDSMEQIKASEQFSQTMGLEKEKMDTQVQTSEEKMNIEREKMNAQMKMKEMDVQIARENKNKHDAASKRK